MSQNSDFDYLLDRWARRVSLNEDDRRAMLALPSTRRTFHREAYLVREGESAQNCHLLLSGFAYRQKLITHGSRQIISIHIAGEFADLQNALLDFADHNVQSLARSEVAIIPRGALIDLIATQPAIGRAVWFDTLVDASMFREWVVNVGRRDAKARIAHLLCQLMLRLRSSQAGETVCDFPLTQEQIADATGLTAVHANRTIQVLRKDGLIKLSNSKLTVLDWDRLAEEADFNERYLHHAA